MGADLSLCALPNFDLLRKVLDCLPAELPRVASVVIEYL